MCSVSTECQVWGVQYLAVDLGVSVDVCLCDLSHL